MGFKDWIGWALGDNAQRTIDGAAVYGSTFWEERERFDVDGDNALKLIPFYSATSLIADSLSALPTDFYRRERGRRVPIDPPAWVDNPSPYGLSWFDFIHQGMTSCLVRGNAYGLVMYTGPRISGIVWIHPSKVRVDETGTFQTYWINGKPHMSVAHGGDILHIPAYVMPGSVVGLSPVELFRRQMRTAGNVVRMGDEYFENGVVPTGVLKNEVATLDEKQTTEAKQQFMKSVRHGEPVALDKNWSFDTIALTAEEAGFLTAQKDIATAIGTIFRVDPEDVGGQSGTSLRYSTVEGNQRKFNTRTLFSWAVRFEHGIHRVLPAQDRMKFNLDANVRANTLDQVRAVGMRLRDFTLTNDEARAMYDQLPLTDEQKAQALALYGKNDPRALEFLAEALGTASTTEKEEAITV